MSAAPTRAAAQLGEEFADRLRLRAAAWRSRRLESSARRVGLAVVYHRVGTPPGDPELELDPALATSLFERQVELLAQRYRLVSAMDLCEQVALRRPGERFPVALTFDDDLPSHVRVVAPILRRLGVPSTFFLGGGASLPWWQDLQRAVDGRRVDAAELRGVEPALVEAALARQPRAIRRLAAAIEALDPGGRDELRLTLRAKVGDVPADARLRADDVCALVAAQATIGFHTVGHYDLRTLDDTALHRELTEGRRQLASLAGHEVEILAYPHGKADARVAQAAREAGFRLGFTGRAMPVRPDDDPLLLGRVQPSFRSLGRFALSLVEALAPAA